MDATKTLETFKAHVTLGFGYPLTTILGALFIYIFKIIGIDNPILAVNFMSALTSAISIALLYLFVKNLFNDYKVALLSSLTLSISPIFLGTSLYGMSHAPAFLFLVCSLWFLSSYGKNNQINYLILSGIFLGCMGACRIQEMIFLIPAITYFFFTCSIKSQPWSKRINKFLLFSGCIFVVLVFFYCISERSFQFSYMEHLTEYIKLSTSLTSIDALNLHLPRILSMFRKSFTFLGILIFLIGTLISLRKHPHIIRFLLLWVIFPTGIYLFLSIFPSSRFLSLVVAPIIIIQSFFVIQMTLRFNTLRIPILASYLGISFFALINIFPLYIYRHQHSTISEFAQWITNNTEKNAKVMTSDEGFFLRFYGSREYFRCLKSSKEDLRDRNFYEFRDKLYAQIDNGIPLYSTNLAIYAPECDADYFPDMFQKYFYLRLIGKPLFEDWHSGYLNDQIFHIEVYKIEKRLQENQ